MPSTVTIQNTIDWARGFLGFAFLNLGTNNEPAITSANVVLQTILLPPFKWRWNRASTSFATNTSTATQDYPESITNFGFIENAYLSGQIELEPRLALPVDNTLDRPTFIAPQLESATQLTFRLQPTPPTSPGYTVSVNYQLAPPTISALTSTGGTWAPIPDYLSLCYSWGFLALMYEYFGNPRSQYARQIFVATLLGLAEGLTEQERNIFASAWLGHDRADMMAQLTAQLGARARGV